MPDQDALSGMPSLVSREKTEPRVGVAGLGLGCGEVPGVQTSRRCPRSLGCPQVQEGHQRGSASSLTLLSCGPGPEVSLSSIRRRGLLLGYLFRGTGIAVKGEKLLSRTQYTQNKTVSQPTFITKNTDLESN